MVYYGSIAYSDGSPTLMIDHYMQVGPNKYVMNGGPILLLPEGTDVDLERSVAAHHRSWADLEQVARAYHAAESAHSPQSQ